MAGKNYVEIAHETTFATAPSTGWRGVEAADDSHQANVLTQQRSGIRRGKQGPMALGASSIVRGGTGTIKTHLLSNGLGLLLLAAIGAPTITTPSGATLARKHVYAWSSTASTFSLATIVGREMTDGNVTAHIRTLQEAGYVSVAKSFQNNRSLTTCSLTATGRKSFAEYIGLLEQIVQQTKKP